MTGLTDKKKKNDDTSLLEKYAYLDSFEGLPSSPAPTQKGFAGLVRHARELAPGLAICFVIGFAAMFLSDNYGAPVMLFALLLGLGFHFLSEEGPTVAGIQFASRDILRLGVALLGARITLGDITGLGWQTVALVFGAVGATILFGAVFARVLGLSRENGLLSGGAVAICGASAALALSSVMPRHPNLERDTMITVIGVTTLSTIAMVAYPALISSLGFDPHTAGIFLGATIHDVAQVVGAGYTISLEAGDTSTIVKLLRVAMLVPVVVAFGYLLKAPRDPNAPRQPILPWFLIGFLVLVLITSTGMVPQPVTDTLNSASRLCLITAIAALGIKTSFQKLAVVGWRPVALMIAQTAFIALLVLAVLMSGLV